MKDSKTADEASVHLIVYKTLAMHNIGDTVQVLHPHAVGHVLLLGTDNLERSGDEMLLTVKEERKEALVGIYTVNMRRSMW